MVGYMMSVEMASLLFLIVLYQENMTYHTRHIILHRWMDKKPSSKSWAGYKEKPDKMWTAAKLEWLKINRY